MKRIIFSAFIMFFMLSGSNAQTIQDARKLTEDEQYDAAISIYQQLIRTNPNDVTIYYFYGDNLLLNLNADSASIMFEKGAAIDGNNPLIKIGRAKVLLDAINLKEAKSASEKEPNEENQKRFQEAQA